MSSVEVVIPYRPRPLQRYIHENLKRWNVLVCHRRFGKTILCINQLIIAQSLCEHRAPRYGYIGPLFKQVKGIAWDYLKYYTGVIPGIKAYENECRVDFPNGSRITLYGSDNPDALRGHYLDGAILDEPAQMSSRLFPEIIRPALADRKGFCIFIGTPMGQNSFYERYWRAKQDPDWFTVLFKASDTKILDEEELVSARKDMSYEQYMQEFECSFEGSIPGAYYARQIVQSREAGLVTKVPHQDGILVHTAWDIGVGDSTAIWFYQNIGREIHIIDHYEMSGEGLTHYAEILEEKKKKNNYLYGKHFAPHDMEAREFGSGKSRVELAQEAGIDFTIAPKLNVEDGIEAVRRILPLCYFDEKKCRRGLEALQNYRKGYDEKNRIWRLRPIHDWSSHSADAFRCLAVMHQFESLSTFNDAWKHVKKPISWMAR